MHNVLEKSLEIILGTKNEASLDFQKSIFEPLILAFSSFLVRFPVEIFLSILKACYAYEKYSLGPKLSFDITYSNMRHVKMVWRQLRAIFVDFWKMILRKSENLSKIPFFKRLRGFVFGL